MAITEESRHRLYQRLDEVLGVNEAATLMEHLPPVGWADVATKHDLEMFRLEFRAELHNELRKQLVTFLSVNFALAGLVLAAARGIH